jgi:WD40 repeat protein
LPSPDAQALRWVFGFNKDVFGGVHSLSDEYRTVPRARPPQSSLARRARQRPGLMRDHARRWPSPALASAIAQAIFYLASNNGVIYDSANKTQKLLLGHANAICSCCVSEDKRWIVTADIGPDPMLVVWDSYTALAVKTIMRPHLTGVQAMDISCDGNQIVTLSRDPGGGEAQVISVWHWMTDGDGPAMSAEVAVGDIQRTIRFAPDDSSQLISNGNRRVVFWAVDEEGLQFYSPPVSQRDFKQPVGDFTVSHILPGTNRAISATTDGDVVLWDRVALPETNSTDRRAVKVVRMHPNSSLNYIAVLGGFIVTAGADGHVRFFDFEFRVVAWFEDLDAGPIVSLSFARAKPGVAYADKTAQAGTLHCPDFVVGTLNALIIGCSASLFDELEESARRGSLLVQGNDAPVHGLALHPSLPRFALCGYSGTLQLWDYDERRILLMRLFDRLLGSALAFDAKGKYLAAGFTNGTLKVLNGMTLEEVTSFRVSREVITKIGFSSDLNYFATADLDHAVCVFKWAPKDDDDSKPKEWVYLGKHNAHYKAITDLKFGIGADGSPELVSIGQDRTLIMYDLARSSVTGGIVLKSSVKIEQLGVPTACMWHNHGGVCALDQAVLVATDQFKFRLYEPKSKAVRSTLLAPAHGGPATAMALVPQEPGAPDSVPRFLAYATSEKVAGLVKLPLDGSPQRTMGAICHAGQISAMGVSWDGRWLITAGGADLCVHMTKIQPEGMRFVEDPDASPVDPFMELLEGGPDGAFVQEIVDYFYYAQLRSQGEDSKQPRVITGAVPLTELANLVRALGHYPSEKDVEYMLHEASYMTYHETGEVTDQIGFDDFIRRERARARVGRAAARPAVLARGVEPCSLPALPGARAMHTSRIPCPPL